MKTFSKYILGASLLLAVSSCAEKELGDIVAPSDGYVLPQGGNVKADSIISQLYADYDSYFLYHFNERDFQWSMVSTSMGSNGYAYTALSNDSVCDVLHTLDESLFKLYSKDILRKALPKRVFLCQDLLMREAFSTQYYPTLCRYQTYQIAVSNPGKWEDLDALSQKEYKGFLNSIFLLSMYNSGTLVIPDEFFSISNYNYTDRGSGKKARKEGFVINMRTGYDWAKNQDAVLTKTDDVDAYLACLVYRTDEEWESDLQYEKVQRKYTIIVEALKDLGIEIKKIGNIEY